MEDLICFLHQYCVFTMATLVLASGFNLAATVAVNASPWAVVLSIVVVLIQAALLIKVRDTY